MIGLKNNSLLSRAIKTLPGFSSNGVSREEIVVAIEPCIRPEVIERCRTMRGDKSYESTCRWYAQSMVHYYIKSGRIVKTGNDKYKIILNNSETEMATV